MAQAVNLDRCERAFCRNMDRLEHALTTVAAILEVGTLKHPKDDGFKESAAFQIAHATKHLQALERGDIAEDHLAHAATRLLMALQARAR